MDWSFMKLTPQPDIWMTKVGDRPYEIIIRGDTNSPHPERLEVAKLVMENINPLEAKAIEYLSVFISAEFRGKATWEVDGVELGRCVDQPIGEFTLTLSLFEPNLGVHSEDSDDYGLWFVEFQLDQEIPYKSWPHTFGRMQY